MSIRVFAYPPHRELMRARRRRLTGLCLVLAVVLATLVVTHRDGVRVGGFGVVAPSIAVPAAGDCVNALTRSGPPLLPLAFGFDAAVVGDRSVVFADCADAHIGEVVAFRRITGDSGSVSDGQWCSEIAIGYSRLMRRRVGPVTAGVWVPVVAHRFLTVVSSADADTEGRRWAACAVMSPGLERYDGSYVQSMAGTPVPRPFGICRVAEPVAQRVSCLTAHDEQVLAIAAPGAVPTLDSCRAVVQKLTAMSDLTGGGRLDIDVSAADSSVVCRIRALGPVRLIGTLNGIGDGPLPFDG